MPLTTVIREPIAELTTAVFTGTLVDPDGTPFTADSPKKLESLRMTIYDAATRATIVNSVDVLESVDAEGNLELKVYPEENLILGEGRNEEHVMLLAWSWTENGEEGEPEGEPEGEIKENMGKHEIRFTVKNLDRVE